MGDLLYRMTIVCIQNFKKSYAHNFKKLLKNSKIKKHLKPANMIKREFELSGRRKYMI